MKKNQKKLGVTAVINESGVHNIRSLRLAVMEVECKAHARTRFTRQLPVWSRPFNATEDIVIECQCNLSGSNQGKWYGSSLQITAKNKDGINRSAAIARKLLGDGHVDHEFGTGQLIESVFKHCIHLDYDSRFYDYVEVSKAEELKNVRGWHDKRSDGSGCTVHAWTDSAEPNPDQIKAAIKEAMCSGGYANRLIEWAQAGMPYGDLGGFNPKHAEPWPAKFFLDFPTTLVHPKDAWNALMTETQTAIA